MSTHLETIVVGGGQAGLATAYHLTREGRPCLVLDAGERVGDGWRAQWDSLRLYSPARYDGLPSMPFPGDPWHYPGKDEVADYLETYARRFELPVQLGTRVTRVGATSEGYLVETETDDFVADNVVVATGTFGRRPNVPHFARDLAPATRQLHSSEYQRSSDVPDGAVLVVGASHSGFDVAYELGLDHPTTLAGPSRGEIPVPHGSRRFRMMVPILWFVWGNILNRRNPVGRRMMEEVRFHGGPALRVKNSDLVERGVERVEERVVGVDTEGRPVLTGGRALDVATVVWATGFRQDFSWIDLPGVTDSNGWPREDRGVVAKAPGLYFCGLSMQRSFRSMLIGGVGADAAFLSRHITGRTTRVAA